MGNRIQNKIPQQILDYSEQTSTSLTDPMADLSEGEKEFLNAIGMGDARVTQEQVDAAKKEVGDLTAGRKAIEEEGKQARIATEKQQMVEQLVQGLGKILGGILGEKEGFTADIKTSPSDFSAILAGRMQEIENKRKGASEDIRGAEERLNRLMQMGARQEEIRRGDVRQRDNMVFQASLQKLWMDMQNRQRLQEKAEEAQKEKDKEAQGNIAAALTQFTEQSKQLRGEQDKFDALFGDLGDEKKAGAASYALANKLGMLTSEFEDLNDDERQQVIAQKKEQLRLQEESVDRLRTKLSAVSKTGKVSPNLISAMDYVAAGIPSTSDANAAPGELMLPDPATLTAKAGEGLINLTAAAKPELQAAIKNEAKEIYGMGIMATGAEDSGLKKLIQTGNPQTLTPEEKLAVSKTDLYKNLKKNDKNNEGVLTKSLVESANNLKARKRYDALKAFVPGISVNIYGIGE